MNLIRNKTISSSSIPAPIADWLESEVTAERLHNGQLLIQHRGQSLVDLCFGRQSDSSSIPVCDKTQYWIASMTKPILSVACLLLCEAGKLELDEPVNHYIPSFGEAGIITPDGRQTPLQRQPTIRDLLRHTSGLTYGQFGDSAIHRRYRQERVYDFTATNEQMAERVCQLPLLSQPGTTFEYGMSTDLLGRIIELICGRGLQDALNELVLFPLGMLDTSFRPVPERLAAIPDGPVRESLAPPFDTRQRWQSGGAGLVSTAHDYQFFAQMLLSKGQHQGQTFLSRASFDQMTSDALPTDVAYGPYTGALGITAPWPDNGLGFGLGLAVRTKACAHIPGGVGEMLWPGVSGTNFWVDPMHNLSVIFLTHAPEHRVAHRIGLRHAVYQSL